MHLCARCGELTCTSAAYLYLACPGRSQAFRFSLVQDTRSTPVQVLSASHWHALLELKLVGAIATPRRCRSTQHVRGSLASMKSTIPLHVMQNLKLAGAQFHVLLDGDLCASKYLQHMDTPISGQLQHIFTYSQRNAGVCLCTCKIKRCGPDTELFHTHGGKGDADSDLDLTCILGWIQARVQCCADHLK